MGIIESFRTPKDKMLPIDFKITSKTTDEEFSKFTEEQNKRFNLALRRMKLCSFIVGFTNPFDPYSQNCMGFRWCPHKEWEEHFKKVL